MKIQNPPSLPLPFVHPAPIGLPLVLREVFFMEEMWKSVNDHPNYEISNLGRIKSLCNNKWGIKEGHSKILKPVLNKNGYLTVSLNGKKIYLHRLMLINFIDNIENKQFCNHKDGDRTNNKLSNLEWVTMQENNKHAFDVLGKKGTWLNKKLGSHSRSVKINQLTKSGYFIKQWTSLQEAKNITGAKNISACCYGGRKTSGSYRWQYAKSN